jgi:hypothetical protein
MGGQGRVAPRRRLVGLACVAVTLVLGFTASASAAPPETPSTYAPAAIRATTATLQGKLDETVAVFPVEPGTYEFLYKATPTASTAECESAGASRAPVPPGMYFGVEPEFVSQEVTGLAPNTAYVVCLAARNSKAERTVANAVAFETAPEVPETKTATEVHATSARLEGVLKPPGTKLEYEFQYNRGASCAGGLATARAQGEGAVSAVVEGLRPGTNYTFCLVARNAEGSQETTGQSVGFETPLAPPVVDAEYASSVSTRNATLNATINPDGLATSYRFEYGPTAAYSSSAPAPEGSAGSGLADVPVELSVEGLSPGTTYHYRVVASNSLGEIDGADSTFTTRAGESAGLIDGRGWELVSPPDKHGAALEAMTREGGVIQAAADGDKLAYIAKGPVDTEPAGNRSFAEQQLLATRASGSWSTQDIATAHEAIAGLIGGELSEYRLFSTDLSAAAVQPTGATPLSPAASERTPYRRESSGEFVPLVNPGNVPPGTKFGANEEGGRLLAGTGVQFLAASPDLAHILLSAPQALATGFETGGEQALYEWFEGTLQPVSVLPGGASAAGEGGAATGDRGQLLRNAVSADGRRVFFRTAAAGHLFMRDVGRKESVQLDAPEAGAEGGNDEPTYQGARGDGSQVFFTDAARLTVGATAQENQPDLYVCAGGTSVDEHSCAEKGDLKDLTVNPGEAADVLGAMLGYSEDGQYLYFVANGVLHNGGTPVAGAKRGDCEQEEVEPAAQSCNLYMWHGGVTSLVAVLSGSDRPDWGEAKGPPPTNLSTLTARVSPNGRFLAFMSQRSLTGYDNHDAVSGAVDEEVFLYDATSGKVVCASCDPTGARPAGVHDLREEEAPPLLVDRPGVWAGHWLAGSIPGWTAVAQGTALYQSRYLSNEGRLFFNSPVGLVPADGNGKQDVYEFEPEGVGGCSSSTSSTTATFVREVAGSPVGGCVGLISSGTSSGESAFLDAAAMGPGGSEAEDVFFLTAARLVGTDVDDALDVYNAHVCSSLLPCPSAAVTESPPCATADSCRAAPEPQPAVFGPPASTTTPGSGNLVASPGPANAAAKPLTRAQKLAKALKACRKKQNRKMRTACEKQARRRYGVARARKATSRRRARR